jgi:hypothetical protein
METIIVTRHPALVEFLAREHGISGRVVAHATEADVAGKHVIGVLPLRLACLALTITEVPLNVPEDRRGTELTLEDLQNFAGEPVTYNVIDASRSWPEKMRAAIDIDPALAILKEADLSNDQLRALARTLLWA